MKEHRLAPSLHYTSSERNRAILGACPVLHAPYKPTLWATNPHVQIMLYLRADARIPVPAWEEERLQMADGGTVSLQWWGLDALSVDAQTPVLLVLPTITGCGDVLRGFVRRMHETLGWLVVVCNRRGHGTLPLTSPRFNTLGDTDDLRAQLRAVQRRRPGAPLYAAGISAGSGLLARYLGEEEDATPLRAAVMVCPAYHMRAAFARLRWPYDRLLAKQVIDYFLVRHEAQLKDVPGYAKARNCRTFGVLHDHLYTLAGFTERDAYYKATNPMEVAHRNCTPTLVINAQDDPICTKESLEEGIEALGDTLDSTIIAVTRYGSHCAFFERNRNPRSWAERAISSYFQAAHSLFGPGKKAEAAPTRSQEQA